jgi:hypothetical protein
MVAGAGVADADARAIAVPEAGLVASQGRPFAVVSVPLATGAERLGWRAAPLRRNVSNAASNSRSLVASNMQGRP